MTDFAWRGMQHADLGGVMVLAECVHPDLPEDEAVFAERIALYPEGCLVLSDGHAIEGYALAHPIRRFEPPALNTLIGQLQAEADEFYIHDFVLAPERRGAGHAKAGIARLLSLGEAFATSALVSVYGTADFWSRFGFAIVGGPEIARKLVPYGPGAVYMRRDNRAAAG